MGRPRGGGGVFQGGINTAGVLLVAQDVWNRTTKEKLHVTACRSLIALFVITILSAHHADAQLDVADSLDIKSIRRIQLNDNGTNIEARISLCFVNSGSSDLRVRNANFILSSLIDSTNRIVVGRAVIDDCLIPASRHENANCSEQDLLLRIDKHSSDFLNRMGALLLALCSGHTNLKTGVQGTCDIGIRSGSVWQFAKGLEIDMEFEPRLDWSAMLENAGHRGITIDFPSDADKK